MLIVLPRVRGLGVSVARAELLGGFTQYLPQKL
jgi:hypothetical protein